MFYFFLSNQYIIYFLFLLHHVMLKCSSLSCVWLFGTPWTVAHQAPLSVEFSRQEYWSGLPLPSPGHLPNPGIKSRSPALQTDTLPSELKQWLRLMTQLSRGGGVRRGVRHAGVRVFYLAFLGSSFLFSNNPLHFKENGGFFHWIFRLSGKLFFGTSFVIGAPYFLLFLPRALCTWGPLLCRIKARRFQLVKGK